MNEALKKDLKYIEKYMQKNLMLTLLLKKDRDEDIIKYLSNQDNKSAIVRRAIREYMSKNKCKDCTEHPCLGKLCISEKHNEGNNPN